MISFSDLGLLGLVYFILCFQLAAGFPPLCRAFGAWPPGTGAQWRRALGPAAGLVACGAAVQLWGGAGLLPGLGAAGVWLGLHLRRMLATDPQTRITSGGPFALYPMVLFDLWTLGLTAGVGGLLAL